ncbi:MAG: adenylyl-sulfate kinase [candidate division Zixibacteria bacterium]|nr:adenylyl-sulfate kinase [candidate division Zixibacteria bacterium]
MTFRFDPPKLVDCDYKLSESNKSRNLYSPEGLITRQNRETRNNHKSYIIWLTGLSGSGKSTIARELEKILFEKNYQVMILDGDIVRHGLSSDLNFSLKDRQENIRRIGEAAKLLMEAGIITICAFISPYNSDREKVRSIVDDGDFIETFIDCPLDECERRDPKGLYKKARSGLIKNFTGIDDPFEMPEDPEILINTQELSIENSVNKILGYLSEQNYFTQPRKQQEPSLT